VEDPTRIFRAIRLEQRLRFQIAKHTQNLMRNSVKMGFLQRLSGGRVLSEIVLILKEEDPVPALTRMRDFDLFRFLHPSLKFDGEAVALFERIHHVISWFDLLFLEQQYDRWLIYFYGLMDSLKPEEIEEMGRRFSMNERERAQVIGGRREADRTLLQFYSWINGNYQPKRSEVYSLLEPLSTETKLFMMAKTNQMATRRSISLYFTQLKDVRPLLKGADLIGMGMKPGPSIRRTLANLLKARLDEQVVTQQDEFEFISKERTVEP
jgi:tRNA nucleotidyltransferase (CCA-adding enzyme)